MSATRTQVYLRADQRRRLDERARREGSTLAHVIREAVDMYLADEPTLEEVLDVTFGSVPDLGVPPRDEWARRERERIGDDTTVGDDAAG
jgi:hypothetical protein